MSTISQVTIVGLPQPKSWTDYRRGCLANYAGGHHSDGHLEAFQHGMETVFNLLEAEFPPAEQCKAAPELLAACRGLLQWAEDVLHDGCNGRIPTFDALSPARQAIAKTKSSQ